MSCGRRCGCERRAGSRGESVESLANKSRVFTSDDYRWPLDPGRRTKKEEVNWPPPVPTSNAIRMNEGRFRHDDP